MTSTKEQNLTFRYAFIQGFFWMSFAAIMGFSSLYLLDSGFNNTQIGFIIAVAGTISALMQPVLAGYADKATSPSVKRIVMLVTVIILVLAVLLFFTYHRSFLFTAVFYGGLITLLQLLTPLVNSLGMESLNQGKKLNFGVSRGFGSVAYAVAAYALGIIAAVYGPVSIPISILLIFAAFFLFLILFPFEKRKTVSEQTQGTESLSPLAFFKRYPRFSVVLIGCILIYISHVLLNSFTFQIVASKGGGSEEMGRAMALASIVELPTMFLFVYMVKKVRCHIWFRISGIFFMLKTLGSLLAPNMMAFYGVQFFQILGWALITVSSVYYVNSLMDEADAIKGQAYMTMTYTLGSVLGALIGGILIDTAGVNIMLIFATVSAFIGMLLMLFVTEATDA